MTIDGALVMALVRCETENEQLRKFVQELQAKISEMEKKQADGETG